MSTEEKNMDNLVDSKISRDEISEELKSILSEKFDIDEDDIDEKTSLIDDLDADSLDLLDIVSEIEDKLNIRVQDEQIENIRTFSDAVEAIFQAEDI